MLDLFLSLYIGIVAGNYEYQYRHIENDNPTSQRKVVVVDRRNDLSPEPNQAKASWYDRSVCGGGSCGSSCKTANGEVFDENNLTMACDKKFSLGSKFRIYYGNKSIEVRCTNRGNFAKYGRLFDLSLGSFEKLENKSKRVIKVAYEEIR